MVFLIAFTRFFRNLIGSPNTFISKPSNGAESEAFGLGAQCNGVQSVALGQNTLTVDDRCVALGYGANTDVGATDATAVGHAAYGGALGSTSVGRNARVLGIANNGTAIGRDSTASDIFATAIGALTDAGTQAVALGATAVAAGGSAIAIGFGASSPNARAISIGRGATSTADGQCTIGSIGTPINHFRVIDSSGPTNPNPIEAHNAPAAAVGDAGPTGLLIVMNPGTGAAVRTIEYDIADSAGVGFRALRIAN